MGFERMLVAAALATALGIACGDEDNPPTTGASGRGGTSHGGKGGLEQGTGGVDVAEPSAAGDGGTALNAAGGSGGEPMSNGLYIDTLRSTAEPVCMPFALPVDQAADSPTVGKVRCSILEAAFEPACSCDAPGRSSADPSYQQPVQDHLEMAGFCGGTSEQSCEPLCLCELEQLSGGELEQCQTELDPMGLNGFCYLAEAIASVNPELIDFCPSSSPQRLRFMGPSGELTVSSLTVLVCPDFEP